MKKLLLILLCLPMIGFGQNVYIPDANFKAYLVGNSSINTNGDTEIQVSEAAAVTGHFNAINCGGLNISDFTGIEYFTSLTELYCSNNQITILDLSQNTALIELDCNDNQLISLDVSQSVNLISLECQSNLLECLDISNNPALTEVNFQSNLLEQLNLKNGNWSILEPNVLSNNLTCVEVDNIGYATNNWAGGFDSFVTFNTNCNYTNPCTTVSAIQENSTNKELLKVTDILGRETKQTNQPLFYIYDDGTVEKRIVIE